MITSQLGAYLESLKNKQVEKFEIDGTVASYHNKRSSAMARHNFFNGFHENSGFLGIGKGDFDGNSKIFANLI